jgi:hypothetical protein
MSLINLRYLPKNTFTSIIFPYIKTYHNELALLDTNIKIGNSKFTLKNNTELEYSISEMHKTITINTKISTTINNTIFNIHEKITIKKNTDENKTNDYSNYSINIVNLKNQPYIYSIKCINQPISFDLMNHYTDDIKKMYEQIKK